MKYIDLRSDTVTKPDEPMLKAMMEAQVGDDVLGDDPTVKKLETYVAELFNKEAAVYVPSGTMSNQICLKAQTEPGWELLCERECHIVNYEVSGPVVHSQLLVNLLTTEAGMISAETIRNSIRPLNIHCPLTKIVSLENTHNRQGGTVLPQDEILRVKDVCDEFNLIFHLDGARIWNAHVATRIPLDKLVEPFDSVSVCLSKGLGAPIGSLALGKADLIEKCRRERKLFGGGMRQVGYIAAAGLYAVQNNIERMKDDHENADYLADELNKLNHFEVDKNKVHTNILIVHIKEGKTAEQIFNKLTELKIGSIPTGPAKIRFVTHKDISRDDINQALDRIKSEFN